MGSLTDPIRFNLERSRVLVDAVEDAAAFKALDSLWQTVNALYLEMAGVSLPPGAKAMSPDQIMQIMAQRKEEMQLHSKTKDQTATGKVDGPYLSDGYL